MLFLWEQVPVVSCLWNGEINMTTKVPEDVESAFMIKLISAAKNLDKASDLLWNNGLAAVEKASKLIDQAKEELSTCVGGDSK